MRLITRLSPGTRLTAVAVAIAFSSYTFSARALPAPASRARVGGIGHLQVTEVEFRLILSHGVLKAGPVNLETIDAGVDPHDLRLRQSSNGPELGAPELTPGRRWDGVVNLKPGVYRLWCSLPEHARLGMHATLQVVR